MTREKIKKARRIVIKIGTNSIMTDDNTINYRLIDRLAYTVSTMNQEGKEVVLVSSGAMGVGCSKLGLDRRPQAIPDQQAVAAVGQVSLINIYDRFFSYYHKIIAQLLITQDSVNFPEALNNIRNSFQSLLHNGIIPVVNENDAVAVDEMDHKARFGDNDTLSAIVASIVDADLLILLTDVDGFYSDNPSQNSQARKFDVIHEITDDVLAMAGGKGSTFSTGGMTTKLQAAKHILDEDRAMVIMDSSEPSQILDLLDGEDIGTAFYR